LAVKTGYASLSCGAHLPSRAIAPRLPGRAIAPEHAIRAGPTWGAISANSAIFTIASGCSWRRQPNGVSLRTCNTINAIRARRTNGTRQTVSTRRPVGTCRTISAIHPVRASQSICANNAVNTIRSGHSSSAIHARKPDRSIRTRSTSISRRTRYAACIINDGLRNRRTRYERRRQNNSNHRRRIRRLSTSIECHFDRLSLNNYYNVQHENNYSKNNDVINF
jgi:hypothetical protein